jgi:hypothetical protein
MKETLDQRMYFFVPYNLSPIQQAIQAGHAALRYAVMYPETTEDFVNKHETWIILNGGTTNSSEDLPGSLNLIEMELHANKVDFALFNEPDLNDALTAVCFIADERVFDLVKYPDWDERVFPLDIQTAELWVESVGGEKNVFLRGLLEGKKLA